MFLQYFDTVGWVFWPVKTISYITYTVLVGGDVKHCSIQSNPRHISWAGTKGAWTVQVSSLESVTYCNLEIWFSRSKTFSMYMCIVSGPPCTCCLHYLLVFVVEFLHFLPTQYSAVYAIMRCLVCLSVCLSHAGSVLKWLNLGWRGFHDVVVQRLVFSDVKFLQKFEGYQVT